MLDFIIGVITMGIALVWFKKRIIRRLRDQGTQTELDNFIMDLLYDTSPLPSVYPMSEGSDMIFKLSDLDVGSVHDENYFGDTEAIEPIEPISPL